jgi:alkanesulfonate monooxygenase SsuD/methylene tetrahydromethanopterin reductase-like flavin-dependent oxidoreductase (luciferase family)
MPIEFLLPPGYTSRESMKRVIAAKQSMFADLTLEAAMEHGMMICGSAATVRDHLIDYQKDLGFRNLLTLLQFGTLPEDLTAANAERFARDVMPSLREVGEDAVREAVNA